MDRWTESGLRYARLFLILGAAFFAGMVGFSAAKGNIAASLYFELFVVWFYGMLILSVLEVRKTRKVVLLRCE